MTEFYFKTNISKKIILNSALFKNYIDFHYPDTKNLVINFINSDDLVMYEELMYIFENKDFYLDVLQFFSSQFHIFYYNDKIVNMKQFKKDICNNYQVILIIEG